MLRMSSKIFCFILLSTLMHRHHACPTRCKCQNHGRVYCSRFKPRDLSAISRDIPASTERLYLLDGGVEHFPVEKFKKLKNLEFLNLYTNKLKNMPKNISDYLPRMRRFNAPLNEIENLTLLEGYQNIRVLKLDRNSIRRIEPYTFANLRELRELSLQGNKIESISEFSFHGLNNLRKLDLRENLIRDIHARAFQHVPNLEELLLDTNQLQDIPDFLFAKNDKLRRVYLSKNKIKTVGENAFANLTLEVINLRSNEIEVLPDKSFAEVKISHKIYLNNNYYGCDCALVLRLRTTMKRLYDDNKLSLGNCYDENFHQSPIAALRTNDFNCSICELNPCGSTNRYECIQTDNFSHAYECRETKTKTASRRVPMNFSTRLSPSDPDTSRSSVNVRLVLWVSVSVCVAVVGLVCTLLIWLYYQRKRRRKFKIPTDEGSLYKEIVVAKPNTRSSIYLTMMSPNKIRDTDVLISTP